MSKREKVDAWIDRIRFQVDSLPQLDYQPLPWMGKTRARRSAGVESRWAEIGLLVEELEPRTALDVGCNVGFFTFSLARRGLSVLGVERYERFVRLFLRTRQALALTNVGLLDIELNPSTVPLIPSADLVLYLSVWHHALRELGPSDARALLASVWAKTNAVLVFETGELEMPEDWLVADVLGEDADEGVMRLLAEECKGATIRRLGRHAAFAPDGSICERGLYAAIRNHP
jgi:SAM-dependent methyltransferase